MFLDDLILNVGTRARFGPAPRTGDPVVRIDDGDRSRLFCPFHPDRSLLLLHAGPGWHGLGAGWLFLRCTVTGCDYRLDGSRAYRIKHLAERLARDVRAALADRATADQRALVLLALVPRYLPS